jgi:hypothetical protein
MIGLGLKISRVRGVSAPGGIAVDPDYQALINYSVAQGYTLPSAGQQVLQNQLLVDLKAAGFWNRIDSFAMFATNGSSGFALVDWKRLTNMSPFNAPPFTPNKGFEGNGSSAWIDTGYQPNINATNYTQNSAGLSTYLWKSGTDGRYVIGTDSGLSPQVRMRVHSNPSQALDSQINSATDTQVQNINSNTVGNFHIDRNGSSTFILQFQGALSSVYNAVSGGVPTLPILVFKITTQYADQGISYFIARNGMSQAEKNTLNTIMSTYLNAI